MEFRIVHKDLRCFEHFEFPVELVKLTKEAKNRSFANLSNCHQAPLKQKKFCGECGLEIIGNTCEHKEFKLGREKFAIPAAHLEQIKKSLDSDRIVISEFRELHEIPELWFTDTIFAATPNSRYQKEYAEYQTLLLRSGKVAVGMATIRERPYPVYIVPYDGKLVIRALHFFDEVDAIPNVNSTIPVNETKIDLLLKAVTLNLKSEPFNIGVFVNQREEQENKLIEMAIKGEPLPEIQQTTQVTQVDDVAEIERLRAVLEQAAVITTQ